MTGPTHKVIVVLHFNSYNISINSYNIYNKFELPIFGNKFHISSVKKPSEIYLLKSLDIPLIVRSLNSKIYRLSNLLDKSAKMCMNDLYGIYFKSVRGAHGNTAYFIFYEFFKNHFDHIEKFLRRVYIKSSPDGSELPCF